MRLSQLPLLGLLLAVFVGARVGSPGISSEAAPAAPSTGKGYSSSNQIAKPSTNRVPQHSTKQIFPVVTAAAGSDVVENGCDEVTATSKAGTFQISKALRTSAECLPPLPPIYSVLCGLNPYFNSSADLRHGFERQEAAAEKPILPPCLTGLGDAQPKIFLAMASVPDPKHTHLGLLTDRSIEAIQVAAGRSGYNPYSHFLPWTSDPQKNSDEGSASEGEGDSHEPGVLIFEKQELSSPNSSATTPHQYLAVFLIPELPTTGLDQESFFSAKKIMDQVSDQLKPKQDKPQFILFAGPNFSGSLASLKDLDRQLGPTQCVRAFSGQVTAAKYFNQKKDSCESQLVLTQTPDCAAVPLFVKGLGDYYGYRPGEIALLSEGGTAYGNKAAAIGKGEDAETISNAQEPANVNPDCSDKPGDTNIGGLLNLQFPREISKLRNAYGAATSQTSSTGLSSQQDTDLQMSWQDSEGTRGDDVPAYGGQQTPLSQDAVLSSLATALKTRRIKALGILATDPMDEAFLIRSFRKSSPDVRLFLRDPDLLYLRTPDVGSLNGTLLVNNYPMVLRDQSWSSENTNGDGLVTFSSGGQEARFDAFLLLLRAMPNNFWEESTKPALLEWNRPAGKPRPPEAKVATTDMPPLWLTTIGTTGQFPLAILGAADEATDRKFHPESLDVGAPRRVAEFVWILCAMLGILHVCGLIWPNALPRFFSDDFDLGDPTDTITASKALCHMAILLSLALIQFILGSSYVFFRDSNPGFARLTWFVVPIAVILAATAVVVFVISVVWPWWRSRGGEKLRNEEISGIFRPLLGGILCIVIFATIGMLWIHGVFQPTFRSAFLHFRDLSLTSGVAPCLPMVLLMLTVYLGAWVYLRRLTYWDYRRPELPTLALDSVYPSDFTKTGRLIDKSILGFLESPSWGIAFCLVFLAGLFAFRPWTTMDLTEVVSVRGTLVALFVLAFFVMGLNWFRFVNIWFRLRNILEDLERLPIRHAFERMPAEKSMPIWGWGISDNSFLPPPESIERLRALIRVDESAVSAFSVRQYRSCIGILGKFDRQKKQGIVRLLVKLFRSPQEQLVELPRAVGAAHMVVTVKASPGRLVVRDTPTFGELVRGTKHAMTEVVHQLILFLRPGYWQRGSESSKEEIPPKDDLRMFVLAEDLVAMRYYTYIRYVVTELRNLLFFVAMAFSLLFLAFHTYAFRADQMIDWSFLVLFLILGAGVTVVLYQMELDPILSHFGGSQAGEVGWSFYLNLLKYGAVPFLTIIGSQVPAVSNLLLRWVQPTLQSLR
jgi:hypothetical protein